MTEPTPGPGPRVVTVPDGVTIRQAEQAIALCTRLGVLEPQPGGWVLGVVSAGEGVLDLRPSAGTPLDPRMVELFSGYRWDELVADERPWWRRAARRLMFWRRKRCRPVPCPPFEQVYILGGREAPRDG